MKNSPPLLEFRNISKRFGTHWANQNVSFSVEAGSFHGIVGENGAGKSTIMNILYGLLQADSGEILLNGKPVSFARPLEAIQSGIGMVHQHFMQVPCLTVWENIILGHEPKPYPLRPQALLKELESLSTQFGFTIDLESTVEELGVVQQQQVELLKLIYRKSQIFILDEPTALLSPQDSENLFKHLHRLQDQGLTVILISHKLKEILSHTQQVTVMREGKSVSTQPTQSFSSESLASLIMGSSKETLEKPARHLLKNPILEFNSVSTYQPEKRNLSQMSFQIFSGEIVGLVGIEGQGQEALVEVLSLLRPFSGSIYFLEQPLSSFSQYEQRQRGLSLIPLKRIEEALIPEMSVSENLIVGHHRESTYVRNGWFQMDTLEKEATDRIHRFDIRPPFPHHLVKNLSGGNQQKLVVARETDREVRLLIACHPTRGVDIKASHFIHQQLFSLTQKGAAVLLISSDLDEVFTLSSRILVLRQGRIVFDTPAESTHAQELGLWMTGAKE